MICMKIIQMMYENVVWKQGTWIIGMFSFMFLMGKKKKSSIKPGSFLL